MRVLLEVFTDSGVGTLVTKKWVKVIEIQLAVNDCQILAHYKYVSRSIHSHSVL